MPISLLTNGESGANCRTSINQAITAINNGFGSFTFGAGNPAGGNNGDTYLDTSTMAFWSKSGGSWAIRGYLAKSVSDTQVVFTTPTQGDLHANLSS